MNVPMSAQEPVARFIGPNREDAYDHIVIEGTYRRREIQQKYNEEHGIEPASIQKQVRDLTDRVRAVAETRTEYVVSPDGEISLNKEEIARMIKELESQMKSAAKLLEFEKAAALRDQVIELRRMEAEV